MAPLTAAHGREHRDFVVVAEWCGDAVDGLVSVDPDTRPLEHRDELLAVTTARGVEQLPEGGDFVAVVGATGGVTRLREQAEPDAQRCP